MASEWRESRFEELCDVSRGASPRPIHEWVAKTGIPWVKISDASSVGSRYIEKTAECIRADGRAHSVSVYPGDLILSNSATPGIPMLMRIEACIHDGWLLLRNFRNLDKLFAYYLLLHERPALIEQGSGSVFTNLKTEILKKHRVRLPPLPEQRAIAHILGTLDDKIELNRRMSRTLEEMARALFKSWFVDFDPVRAKAAVRREHPDWSNTQVSRAAIVRARGSVPRQPEIAELFPDRLVDSELGEIPEGWGVDSMGKLFRITMGQSPPGSTYNENGEGIPFYQGRMDFGFRFPARRVFCTGPTRLAVSGDTLVTVRAPVGDVNMAIEGCAIGRGVAAIRHKTGSRSFTYYFMQALRPVFQNFEAEGTVFGAISKEGFISIRCVAPPRLLIDLFEKMCNPLDDQIEKNERESRTLAALRDALLPKLISGQIRVKDAESFLKERDL